MNAACNTCYVVYNVFSLETKVTCLRKSDLFKKIQKRHGDDAILRTIARSRRHDELISFFLKGQIFPNMSH